MKFKSIMLMAVLLAVLTVGAVSAADINSADALAVEDNGDSSIDASLNDEILTVDEDNALSQNAEDDPVLGGSNTESNVIILAMDEEVTTDPNATTYDDSFIWVAVPKDDVGRVIVTIGETTVFNKTLKEFSTDKVQSEVINKIKMKNYAISFTDLKNCDNFYSDFKTGDVVTVSVLKSGKEIEWNQYSLSTNENAMNFQLKGMVDTMVECVDWYRKGNSNKAYFGLKNPNNDKPLSGYKLTLIFNGNTYVKTTDKNGRVYLAFDDSKLVPKTYTITAKFAGDAKYVKSVETIKFTVKKTTPKLIAAKKTFKSSLKTKKYTVTLKSATNKAISKVKVTLKVKGKTYKATTNSKGKATFKITKLTKKGTFKAVVTFAGNSFYKKVSKKVTIVCK